MNFGESNATGKFLRWFLQAPSPSGRLPTNDEAREAAEILAKRAYETVGTGLRPIDVRAHWPAEHPQQAAAELSDLDLHTLRKMAAIPCETPDCPCPEWRRQLADFLRHENPDLSDAVLARVLLKVGGLMAHYSFVNNLHGAQAAGVVSGAAVELAALEIGDPSK